MVQFSIKQRDNINITKYHERDLKLATQFATSVYKELKSFVKAIVLFGSTARETDEKKSDVDMLLIVDDVHVVLTKELMEAYKIIVDKKIAQVSNRLHVVTLKLTTFWEYVRAGDPLVINILRDGIPLIDSGFFDPLQALLYTGRIRPTQEAINSYFNKAPLSLNNADWHVLQAVLDLYWAVTDASHAALMSQGLIPPSPEHIYDMLKKDLVKERGLPEKNADDVKFFYNLMKKITYRDIKYISGEDYDRYRKKAHDCVQAMAKFVRELS